MKWIGLLHAKLIIVALISAAVVGGATAAFAATPAGQRIVHGLTVTGHAQMTPSPSPVSHQNNSKDTNKDKHQKSCPGLPEAQQLAAKYGLSTESQGAAVMALCALHTGTFKGTTPTGTVVSSQHVFGYGEIDMLLAYARYLATHDQANASGSLANSNVQSYLALALKGCGTTPVPVCVTTALSGHQPGHGSTNGTPTGTGHGNNQGAGNGNSDPGQGKGGKPGTVPPTGTPAPHH